MKNESEFLQAAQDLRPDPTIVHLPLYRAGTRVSYQDREYTVGHVVVVRSQLMVYLQELGNTVNADKLQIAPTRLVLQRS